MRKLVFVFGVLLMIAVCLFPFAVFGQEATPEPTPVVIPAEPPAVVDYTPTVVSIGVILIALALTIGVIIVGREVIIRAFASIPAWVLQSGLSTWGNIEDELDDYVETTPHELDDTALAEIDRIVRELVDEALNLQATRNIAVKAPPDSAE